MTTTTKIEAFEDLWGRYIDALEVAKEINKRFVDEGYQADRRVGHIWRSRRSANAKVEKLRTRLNEKYEMCL